MGKSTDHLVELAKEISGQPNKRDMDMLLSTGEQVTIALLSMALNEQKSTCSIFHRLAGWNYDRAMSMGTLVSPRLILKQLRISLAEGKVVIVAGFQGITENGEITTLGRGGSDTTAVALAAALKADKCEILYRCDRGFHH